MDVKMTDFGKNGTGKHTNNAEIKTMSDYDRAMDDTDYSMEYDSHKKSVASSDASKARRFKLNEQRQP